MFDIPSTKGLHSKRVFCGFHHPTDPFLEYKRGPAIQDCSVEGSISFLMLIISPIPLFLSVLPLARIK